VILDLGGKKVGHEYLWRKRGGHGGRGGKNVGIGCGKVVRGQFFGGQHIWNLLELL
jgi:hypothetical protein